MVFIHDILTVIVYQNSLTPSNTVTIIYWELNMVVRYQEIELVSIRVQ